MRTARKGRCDAEMLNSFAIRPPPGKYNLARKYLRSRFSDQGIEIYS